MNGKENDEKELSNNNDGDGEGDVDCEMKNDNIASNEETEEKYDKAINAWKNACMPLKLSVEVITNLCARRVCDKENGDFDEMNGWDLEGEEHLLSSCVSTPDFTKPKSGEDGQFLNAIVSSGIP